MGGPKQDAQQLVCHQKFEAYSHQPPTHHLSNPTSQSTDQPAHRHHRIPSVRKAEEVDAKKLSAEITKALGYVGCRVVWMEVTPVFVWEPVDVKNQGECCFVFLV